jgi:hypothetical protein
MGKFTWRRTLRKWGKKKTRTSEAVETQLCEAPPANKRPRGWFF